MGKSMDEKEKELMQDPKFREEYEKLQPEFDKAKADIEARMKSE